MIHENMTPCTESMFGNATTHNCLEIWPHYPVERG